MQTASHRYARTAPAVLQCIGASRSHVEQKMRVARVGCSVQAKRTNFGETEIQFSEKRLNLNFSAIGFAHGAPLPRISSTLFIIMHES